MSGSIFDEIQLTNKLITRQRELLYSLQEDTEAHAHIIREKIIMIKALECYLASLEGTVNARSRKKSTLPAGMEPV